MFIGGGDPYQEAIDLIEEFERGNVLKGKGGFSSISTSNPEYVKTVVEEIMARGYAVRIEDDNYITIEKQRQRKMENDDELCL